MSYPLRILLTHCVFCLFWSCGSEGYQAGKIDYPKGSNCDKGYQPPTTHIDKGVSSDLVDLINFSQGLDIIPLTIEDPSLLMGEVTKSWSTEHGDFFIADLEVANKVYSFDSAGGLKFAIDNVGQGPGQYNKIWDVQYNRKRGTLEIWDLTQHKMIRYDGKSGVHIEDHKVDLDILTFFPITEDWYVYHVDGRNHLGQKKPLLLYSDITGTNLMNAGATEYGLVDTMFDKMAFSAYSGSGYYLGPMMDTIYWLGPVNRQICADRIINYGSSRLTDDIKSETDLMQMANKIQEDGSSYTTGSFVMGGEYLYFQWSSERKEAAYHQFVNKFYNNSFQVKTGNMSAFGIQIMKLLEADRRGFTGYSILDKVDQDELRAAISSPDVSEEIKASLKKVLEIEDPEMPFLISFELKPAEVLR